MYEMTVLVSQSGTLSGWQGQAVEKSGFECHVTSLHRSLLSLEFEERPQVALANN